jgi:hypothetical protein
LDVAHKPAPGVVWSFNVIRHRLVKSEATEQSSWNPCADKFNAAFCGELVFEQSRFFMRRAQWIEKRSILA